MIKPEVGDEVVVTVSPGTIKKGMVTQVKLAEMEFWVTYDDGGKGWWSMLDKSVKLASEVFKPETAKKS